MKLIYIYFFERFFQFKKDLRCFPKIKIACVGVKTAEALEKFYLKAHYINTGATSLDLAKELIEKKIVKKSALFVRAQEGREELVNFFKEKITK